MRRFTLTRLPSGNILASSDRWERVYIYRGTQYGGDSPMVWRAYAILEASPFNPYTDGKPELRFLNLRHTLLRLVRCINW
jgi:hypothetical protein